MFKWLNRKITRDRIKTLEQNRLAAKMMRDYFETMEEMGGIPEGFFDLIPGQTSIIDVMWMIELKCDQAVDRERIGLVTSNAFWEEQIGMNKTLRHLYDGVVLAGSNNPHARHLGIKQRPPFDEAFRPQEGWEIFFRDFR